MKCVETCKNNENVECAKTMKNVEMCKNNEKC